MSEPQSQQSDALKKANLLFYEKANKSVHHLFDLAKEKNELHFAFSLAAEFRGMQDPGWNTAMEAHGAFEEYMEFMKKNPDTGFNARVALAFYCHLAEASGFYEIPKNMLRVAEGQRYKAWPFEEIVEPHKKTGESIAPNANKVIRNLVGHATTLGLNNMAEVFRDAFDSDVRNGFSHADYVIWNDGIRLPKRNGGTKRIVSWSEFNALLERGINFFNLLSEVVQEYRDSYNPPKVVRGQSGDAPECDWTICCNPETKTFSFSCL
jgi:hypothetical protein